ncbi:hypothetical protein Bca101_001678 [Brassica carinata]
MGEMGEIAGGFDGVCGQELGGGKPSTEMGDDANDFVERDGRLSQHQTPLPLSLSEERKSEDGVWQMEGSQKLKEKEIRDARVC